MSVCRVLSTLELIYFRALGVHVGVVERVARGVADGRWGLLWSGSVRKVGEVGKRRSVRVNRLLGSVCARVEAQVWELGWRVAELSGQVVAEVLQVHEPLGPEAPADALTVHGQVDELACEGQRAQ